MKQNKKTDTRHLKPSFSDQLARCECCPRKCGVDRLGGKTGFCKTTAEILISHAGLHFGEEPPISGTQGSGAFFFAGCNLKCVFCQNYQISQDFLQHKTSTLTATELASEMLELQNKGAHNINFVSPSHTIFQMADAIEIARHRGLTIPVVYNSNGYDDIDALKQIKGLVDIFLPDIKYMDNDLGKRFSKVDDYADIVFGVLYEMLSQVGHLELDDKGIAVKGLLVRHLVLPGHLDNTLKCLEWVAHISKDMFISIMSQYSPLHQAGKYPEINRCLTNQEYDQVINHAIDLGLDNAFIQELESQDHYVPDFTKESPFENR